MTLTHKDRNRLQRAAERSIPEVVPTEWFVLSGPPGSGKTSLSLLLQDHNTVVVRDPARELLARDTGAGISVKESKRNYLQFQKRVLRHSIALLKNQDPFGKAVLDYGLAESLAFLKAARIGWDEEVLRLTVTYRFRAILILEPLSLSVPQEIDPLRTESPQRRKVLFGLMREIYIEMGYEPIIVPVLPLAERLGFVRSAIGSFVAGH